MIKESVSLTEAIQFLNDLLALDKDAITNLIHSRVSCNEELANHPTVQVGAYDMLLGKQTPGEYHVGILGILNGLFGIDDETGMGPILANVTDLEREVISFIRYKKGGE